MNRLDPTQIGPYRIVRRIGEGGMGIVYEAENEQIERRVAIKCLNSEYATDAEAMQRFFNEARASNRINHPSIVQISDSGTTPQGGPFIVMEFLEGQTLAARLQAGVALPITGLLPIAWQIADALSAAHEKQIVHRDLKPENVMLIADPVAPGRERVKILDFGIAKLARTNVELTSASAIMGTPRYMAPEQCRGAGAVDDRADVYSLGVMLFEMVSGRLPFEGEGAGELIAQHLYKEPPALRPLAPDAPESLVILIESLLRKSAVDRPSMREVSRELEALAGEHGALGGRPSRALPIVPINTSEPTGRRASSMLRGELESHRRSGLLVGGLALTGVLLLIAVVTTFRQIRHSSPTPPVPLHDVPHVGATKVVADPSVIPSPPHAITWDIETTPTGATVLNADGKVMGTTPLSLSRMPQRGDVSLLLRLAGYRDRTLTLQGQRDAHVREQLQPLSKRSGKSKLGSRPELPQSSAKATSYED